MTSKSGWSRVNSWGFEILALASSILMVIAMAALLAAFDGKPIFESKTWTLNAFISTLSTASKAALLTTVGSCISQGNWVLFSGYPRRLYDFESVSEASRGPLGSLKVLANPNLRGGLPNGLSLNNQDGKSGPGTNTSAMAYMTMRGMSDPNETVAMRNLDTLIWSQTIIAVDVDSPANSSNTWPDFEVTASECALYYCVREYNTKYKDGLLSTTSKELKSYKRDPESWASDDRWWRDVNVSKTAVDSIAWHPQDSGIMHGDLSLRADDVRSVWNVSYLSVIGISHYMQSVFAACLNSENCTEALSPSAWNVTNGYLISVPDGLDGARTDEYRPSLAKVMFAASPSGLEQKFENIAASMSNAIRRGGDGNPRGMGDILRPVTIYVVVWPWIMLHCVTELGAVVLLVLTIWPRGPTERAVPIWKSSELAVLSKGVILGEVFKDARTAEELEERARQVPVLLFAGSENSGLDDGANVPLVKQVGESETGRA